MVALVMLLRAIITLGAFLIVLSAALDAWASRALLLAVAAFVFFPVTLVISPWLGGLQLLWIVSMLAFVASNLLAARSGEDRHRALDLIAQRPLLRPLLARAPILRAFAADGAEMTAGEDPTVDVFVEVPMGSRNKYEWDFDRGAFILDRMLFSSVRYPGDYGFIPETLALDGDHLDALVILGEPTFPGCTIKARVLGMLDMTDDKGPDEKILTVASHDPRWRDLHRLEDVPDHLQQEILHFFATYKDLERKFVEVRGWRGRDEAMRILEEARARWPGHTTPAPWPR